MSVDYGNYATKGKRMLLAIRAMVNGRKAVAYVKNGKVSSLPRQSRRRKLTVSSLRSWHWTAASEMKDSSREASTMSVT